LHFLPQEKVRRAEDLQKLHKAKEATIWMETETSSVRQRSEYTSDALDHILVEEGIIWEPTIGYSPSENGVSERLNRTLCEKLRGVSSYWIRCLDTVYPLPRKCRRGHIL